jgi:replication-associated recombination protein RarA
MRYLITEQGYDFFEVSSALQKSIRRGLEDDAMYWAVELYNSNYDEYIWKRLKIISSEDIGLAEPNLSSNIYALYEMYQQQKKNDKTGGKTSHRLFLAHAIVMLCRAKKSRLIDHFQIYHFRTHHLEKKPIPDFAFDKHTTTGKRNGRGFEHFFEHGAKLENLGDVEGEEKYLELCKDVLYLNPPPTPTTQDDEQKSLFD